MRIPPHFQDFLHNDDNKEMLFELLEETWIQQQKQLGDRTVYLARKYICTRISRESVCLVDVLRTDHEEADTKIAYLIKHAIDNNNDIRGCVARSCSGDIDIPVILLNTLVRESVDIFIVNGSGKHRKVLHLNLSQLNEKQRNALVGFHAFSGNDYVSSFFKKSKRTWEIVKPNEEFKDLFCNLAEGPITDEIYTGLEKFVYTIYNENKLQIVNEARSANNTEK